MPLRIPKYAQIENWRLSLFYRLMQAGIVVPLVAYFIVAEQYSMLIPLKNHIYFSNAVRGWRNPVLLAQKAATKLTEPWCLNPMDYNFGGDFLKAPDFLSDKDFSFVGPVCATLCSAERSDLDCINPPEIWRQEGTMGLILLTSFRDTQYRKDGTETSQSFLVPFADSLSIAFSVSYGVIDGTVFRLGREERSPTGEIMSSSQFTQPTKFISSCGNIVKETEPGADLILSVPELFEMVCEPEYLDTIQPKAGKNLHEGAKHKNGALGRVVGAEISLRVFIDSNANTATVRASMSPTAYVGGSYHEKITGDTLRLRQYNGIRVSFSADGVQTVYDVNNIILNVSALVVYVSLPIIFIKFFAVYCLGHLSKIYRAVIYAKFNIAAECGRTATRLMSSTSSFHSLEDVTDADGDGIHGDTGISRRAMASYIEDVMKHRDQELDEAEIRQFVNLAFNEIDTEDIQNEAPTTVMGNIKAMLIDVFDIDAGYGSRKKSGDGFTANINLDEFNNAFHSAFPMNFESVVKLFDKDRNFGILEGCFMPDKLKEAIKRSRNTTERSDSEAGDQLSQDALSPKSLIPVSPLAIHIGHDTAFNETDPLRASAGAEQYEEWR